VRVQERPAKLEGALEGAEREAMWGEHKVLRRPTSARPEPRPPLPHSGPLPHLLLCGCVRGGVVRARCVTGRGGAQMLFEALQQAEAAKGGGGGGAAASEGGSGGGAAAEGGS
jgi:hypothetical protein